jgi:hypothetical protein
MLDEIIKNYINVLIKEQESLIAKYISETGFAPSEICIVERATENGRVFFVDKKCKYIEELTDEKT